MNRFAITLLAILCLCVSGLYAQRQALSIQGVLRDATNASVADGSYSIVFKLYTVSSGGSAAWTEGQNITVSNGVYSATLGSVNPAISTLDYSVQYWLGITVNGQAEMTPRTQLTLSPYAILGGVSGTTNIVPTAGNVGIGTLSPDSKLEVVASGNANPAGNGVYNFNPTNTSGQDAIVATRVAGSAAGNPFFSLDISGEAGYSLGIDNADANKFKISNAWNSLSAATRFTLDGSGNVGIGTTSPAYKLEINGSAATHGTLSVMAGTDDNLGVVLFSNNQDGASASAYQGGISSWNGIGFKSKLDNVTRLMMDTRSGGFWALGNVGIGTASPTDRLHVVGGFRVQGGYVNLNPTADNSSGNTGIGGIVYSNVKLTVSSNQDYAAYIDGYTYVKTLAKGSGSFKIDHPLDPTNKFLYHSFVESPDMMNVYNGNVTTNGSGLATVALPSYFQALNKDYRYQLTVIGQFAQAIVEQEVSNNSFVIRTDKPNVKVSWQVTGIRQDAFAKAHPIVPEVDKSAEERGKYLNPLEAQQPASAKLMPGTPVNPAANQEQ